MGGTSVCKCEQRRFGRRSSARVCGQGERLIGVCECEERLAGVCNGRARSRVRRDLAFTHARVRARRRDAP